MNGAIILDKAEGVSSHSAVLSVRRLLSEPRTTVSGHAHSEPRIGHLGTLDPFASGVLVLLVGQATRLARFYREREKTYLGTIRFGYSTDSYDRTGRPTSPEQPVQLDPEEIRRLFGEFLGTSLQRPPALSAKKVGGVPAYRLARQGQELSLQPVPVTIHELEVLAVDAPRVKFRARVSAGTYLRSLAHELGMRLGVGAHLEHLRRTAVGEFGEAVALSIEQLEEKVRQGAVPLIPAEDLLPEFPALAVPAAVSRAVLHGNSVTLAASAKWLRVLDESGTLRAVAERLADGLYHPVVVFPQTGEPPQVL